jgi:hypothetical protein
MGEIVRGPWEWWAPSWCAYFAENKKGQIRRDEARRAARNKKRREAAKAKRDAKRAREANG